MHENAFRPKAHLYMEVVVPMSGFGANIASLRAQRILAASTNTLSRVNERLASGQRINRASDDAAGLAIASTLNTKSRIYGQSIRNINDGISTLSIAGGVTESLSGIITRLKELATQAANGSYSSPQRAAMDTEAQSLRTEYNRLVDSTTFNGIRILNQSTGRMRIAAGETSAAAALYIDPSNLKTGQLGTGVAGSALAVSSFGANVSKIRTGDLNQDGYQDLVGIEPGSTISVRLGNGDGTFRNAVTYSAGAYEDVQIGDVNNDGTLDLVAASNDFKVFLGNGDGTFRNGQTGIFTDAGNTVHSIALKDFNGDGRLDIAAGDGQNLLVNAGTSNGGFSSSSMYSTPVFGSALDIRDIKVGDFDGDGKSDIVVAGDSASSAFVLFGNGNGLFTSALEIALNGANSTEIAVGDLNNDGRSDIVVGQVNNTDYFTIKTNRTANAAVTIGGPGFNVAISDLNGDGKLDVIGADGAGIELIAGNGNGTFAAASNYYSTAAEYFGAADFNGDGVTDLLSTDGGGTGTALLTNSSDSSYLNSISLSTRGGAYAALRTLDSAHTALGSAMGRIGADQSRLQSALSVITATRENYGAAESRIKDADMASEVAAMTSTKILQETAASLLNTINLQPSLMLQLLKSA
ncbi:MAG: FG-GAP-like repeat-containing protein [Oligoflexia bacterium]|nr:FG-GAP-like repeat-containing protein [Oligoflexia bacterium]